MNDIVSGDHFGADTLWMMPNIGKMITEEEAGEFWRTIDDTISSEPLDSVDCNLIISKINGLEAIGCFYCGGNSLI